MTQLQVGRKVELGADCPGSWVDVCVLLSHVFEVMNVGLVSLRDAGAGSNQIGLCLF